MNWSRQNKLSDFSLAGISWYEKYLFCSWGRIAATDAALPGNKSHCRFRMRSDAILRFPDKSGYMAQGSSRLQPQRLNRTRGSLLQTSGTPTLSENGYCAREKSVGDRATDHFLGGEIYSTGASDIMVTILESSLALF